MSRSRHALIFTVICVLVHYLQPSSAISSVFNCNYQNWNILAKKPPNQWSSTLSQTPQDAAPAGCRHCWWDLGYPTSGSFVFATEFNCSQWVQIFNAQNGGNPLTTSAFLTLFMGRNNGLSLPNLFFENQGKLNRSAIPQMVDLNRDGLISLEEFLVVMNFWSPIAASQFGPVNADIYTNSISVLGGFFYDAAAWASWLTAAAEYSLRTPLYTGSTWVLALRDPRDFEAQVAFANVDFDSSQRYSLFEHYFNVWGDLNGDGTMQLSDFVSSLFCASMSASAASTLFAAMDVDQDGLLSYREIKYYFANDKNQNDLNLDAWIRYDYDASAFRDHNLDGDPVISKDEYRKYLAFKECSSLQSSTNPTAWSCPVQVFISGVTPFVTTTNSGFLQQLWSIMMDKLQWTITPSIVPPEQALNALNQSFSTRHGDRNISLSLLSIPSTQATDASTYICSSTFGNNDVLSIMTLANPPYISLELVILQILITPSFLRFMAVVFCSTVVAGHFIWFAEGATKKNPQFNPYYVQGILDGLYFSTVTLTTIGYGDKVPITGLGRVISVIWMFLAVICFSIFAGEATSNISNIRAANVIADVSNLPKRDIATLSSSISPDLSQIYGFVPHVYDSVAECASALLNGYVNAVIAPNSMMVSYFIDQGYVDVPCNNPFVIVGSPIASINSNQICCLAASGHSCQYLIDSINSVLSSLKATGDWDNIVSATLNLRMIGTDCPAPDQYPWTIIAIALSIFGFFGILAIVLRLWNERNRRINVKLSAIKMFSGARKQKENSVVKCARIWLKKTRDAKSRRDLLQRMNEVSQLLERHGILDAKMHSSEAVKILRPTYDRFGAPADKRAGAIQYHKQDPMIPLLDDMKNTMSEMRLVVKGLGSDIHILHKEAFEQRRQLGRVMSFFSVVNMISFLLSAFAIAAIIIVWGRHT